MAQQTFKEYYDASKLLKRDDIVVEFATEHTVYKYCKVPFILNEEKTYISFKPKDVINIKWERIGDNIRPLYININEEHHDLVWQPAKMKTWVEQSTTQNLKKL
jgi:hypothetical protein